jgi:hypothetical protein
VNSKETVGIITEKTTSLFWGKKAMGGNTDETARLSISMTEEISAPTI